MKLLVVIPALNEEQSIESIIQRTHEAVPFITSKSSVTSVRIVVVSDGSTDRTVELAKKHLDKIKLIVFEKNRGYGAAIKEGWNSEDADLLGFIDADGTCDPLFFSDLANLISVNNADVALGNRINKQSKMPLIRRIGNRMFATLLSFASSNTVKDTASGMRVVRSSILSELLPLPDGLHFTPAMSARAILSDNITIMEKEMSYFEREGESKLNVWKDGKRFLSIIVENIFTYIPYRIFSTVGVLIAAIAVLLLWPILLFYFANHYLEDWMIYRIVFSEILFSITTLCLFSSNLMKNIVYSTIQTKDLNNNKSIIQRIFEGKMALVFGVGLIFVSFLLIIDSLTDRIVIGNTNEHWSRYIVALFLSINASIFLVSFFINKSLTLVRNRLAYLQSVLKNGK